MAHNICDRCGRAKRQTRAGITDDCWICDFCAIEPARDTDTAVEMRPDSELPTYPVIPNAPVNPPPKDTICPQCGRVMQMTDVKAAGDCITFKYVCRACRSDLVKRVDENPLQEANRLVNGDRQHDYGHPYYHFAKTVGKLNVTFKDKLRQPFVPTDWGIIMNLDKLSREQNWHKRDNLVDVAGYTAGTLDLIYQEMERLGLLNDKKQFDITKVHCCYCFYPKSWSIEGDLFCPSKPQDG